MNEIGKIVDLAMGDQVPAIAGRGAVQTDGPHR